MNKYAIYTEGDVYPVLEKDGEYYIGAPGTGHFSGQWKFLGVVERLKNSRNIIKPEDALKITDWKFKNGSPKYQVVDLDHGTVRRWASPRQVISFGPISDNMFSVATKTDNDEEITLEESKKYNIYATYGGDGVYNSKLVDTVDSEEQAIDRVAELQATGVGASYEEVEVKNESEDPTRFGTYKPGDIVQIEDTYSHKYFGKYKVIRELTDEERNPIYGSGVIGYELETIEPEKFAGEITRSNNYRMKPYKELNEECSQASGVASGANGKIDSFPIDPKEMEKQRLKESEDDIFNAREELINYLNQNTKYEWDANESYDNCAITESETDYIEVFVDIKDGNKIYTVDNYSYSSLEELVKNMPVLFTNEDEDYDYDSNWEDLDESKNDKNLDWIYDENEKLYHCEIDNWYFNIYELEDGTYNLIVDYDENELQDLDDIFDTLEEAKKKAQEIYNKGISEYNGDDFAGFEYEIESKDLTKTLQEMALLEDYEEDKTISPQKQKFIDYCKDKIEDLGDVEIYDEDYEENIQYHKLMHTEGIREFEDLYIIADFDNYENENLIAINNENKIVINTPMIDCNGYAGTMQFDKIDKKFYDQLMDYWDDIYMDEIIEEE